MLISTLQASRLALAVLLLVPLASPLIAQDSPATSRLKLREGDCVVWLGATFIERLQSFGHLETLLTAAVDHPLRLRNLGWSADEVTGISRAVFGSQEDGFQRLVRDLKLAEPTLVVVQYGAVEAEAGEAGEAEFAENLTRLLDEIQQTGARLAIMSPLYRTRPRPLLPDPAPYNAKLDRYCEILAEHARSRGAPWIDIRDLLSKVESLDGVVPSALGYRQIAPLLAERLGYPPRRWRVRLDAEPRSLSATETAVSDIQWAERGVSFAALDRQLPVAGEQATLQVTGLPEGEYLLQTDDRPLQRASSQQWAAGVALPARGGARQLEQLRQAIVDKNELFFHRHRPQNETYLFLFRKHEQGNNAVEVPQFDPLIKQAEGRIAELRIPRPRRYQLIRQ